MAAAVAALLLSAAPTRADQSHPALPGVARPEPIVQPLPEPMESPVEDKDGFARVGDWDVRISGTLRVDIGVGDIKPPRR